MITIVDYGVGNLSSIENMCGKIGVEVETTSDIQRIEDADKIILPGVGAFDPAMDMLQDLGIIPILEKKVILEKTPLLGICLGMQLLTKKSEEGRLFGLGFIEAETLRFRFEGKKLKVPHMGWNTVDVKKESPLFEGMYEEPRFYFVHSYYVKCKNEDDVLTTTNHGSDFCSSFNQRNIYGVQFHPEKSHKFGMALLKNFAEKC